MRKKLLGIIMGGMMLAGALFPTAVFAKGTCGESTFFGMDPWYVELTCSKDASGKLSVDQSNFEKDKIAGTVALIVGTVVKDILFVAGILAVVMIVISGIQYMTSEGEPGKLTKAKQTLRGSIIGLGICALAYAIVTFVLKVVGV